MNRFELVIVGGGLAAARAIKSYREAGGEGRIALLSQETALPYHRPALSKGYLRGEMDNAPFVEEERFYADNDIELVLGTSVAAIAPGARTATAEDGSRYRYRKLLLATGARPRHLNVPGSGLDGVFALRTLADSDAIRAAAKDAERAVVVGGGFIGVEVAASLRSLDLDVTLIHLGSGLFDQLGSDQLSEELFALYHDNGVELLLEEEVASFGDCPQFRFVTTTSGRRVEADFVVVGVGVVPSIDFLESSGLALDNGVLVNERYEAEAPGVFAVGDVANFFDPLYNRRRRIEHWSNADYQGTQVGRLLAGQDGGYDTVSSFFTKVFDLGLKVFGDVSHFDDVATKGTLAERDLVATYGRGGRLVGALAVDPSDELVVTLTGLIEARAAMPAALEDERAVAASVSSR